MRRSPAPRRSGSTVSSGRARALVTQSVRRHRSGDVRGAIDDVTHAVEILREAVRQEPGHRPTLADALSNLAGHLGDTGRRRDGRRPATEAVAMFRELA